MSQSSDVSIKKQATIDICQHITPHVYFLETFNEKQQTIWKPNILPVHSIRLPICLRAEQMECEDETIQKYQRRSSNKLNVVKVWE